MKRENDSFKNKKRPEKFQPIKEIKIHDYVDKSEKLNYNPRTIETAKEGL